MEPSRKEIADLFSVVFDKDLEITNPVRKLKGDNARESSELGKQSLNEGDLDKAIEHFRRAIEQRDPADVSGLVDLAGVYEFAEMAPQALRQYEKALRIKDNSSESRLGMSQVFKRNARYKDSLKHLEEALALEPRNAFYRFKIAEILREMSDKERALESAQLAMAAAPTDSFYHYWVGDLLIEMKRFGEALQSLRAAIELSPGDDYLYLRAASAFWGARRPQEAIKSVRLASDLDPDKDLYHGLLELLLRNSGMVEEAELERERAAKMDDYDRDALRRIAEELELTYAL
jgi:tetratricopeptide (TPR) repeat protein